MPGPRPARRRWSAALAAAVVVAVAPVPAALATVVHDPPVPGAVLRPFDEPAHAYAPGHRGLDLAVATGEPVRVTAPGTVAFAGPVAGEVWVTVAHADGLRTSYGELTDVAVRAGEVVGRGAMLGRATGWHRSGQPTPERGLHLSVRRGEVYLDPATVLGRPPARSSLVGPGGWWASHHAVTPYAPYVSSGWGAASSPRATAPGYALPPSHHHLVLVPGFATQGPHELFPASFLGYGGEDASAFSYAGCDPTPTGCAPRPYGGRDSHVDVEEGARLLEGQLRALQRAQPWRPVDLVGHSQGGDVVSHYVEHVHDPSDPGLPTIGSVVTVATPHRGSATARLGTALRDSTVGSVVVEGGLRLGAALGVPGADRIRLDAPAIDRYGARGGRTPSRDPVRFEELGVPFHPLAGSRDLVVSPDRAAPEGLHPTVLPGGHSSVLDTEATLRAVHDALGGREPVGASGPLVGLGPRSVDAGLRWLAWTIEAAEFATTGRAPSPPARGRRRARRVAGGRCGRGAGSLRSGPPGGPSCCVPARGSSPAAGAVRRDLAALTGGVGTTPNERHPGATPHAR